jgi:hypothetical protein
MAKSEEKRIKARKDAESEIIALAKKSHGVFCSWPEADGRNQVVVRADGAFYASGYLHGAEEFDALSVAQMRSAIESARPVSECLDSIEPQVKAWLVSSEAAPLFSKAAARGKTIADFVSGKQKDR